ncbi:ribonuclease HIII [Ereboglobus sp. PH5-10]|uniref:ribonuclease HIII n=1 Tax=Ereboglobus sp. PH5-10 TaxID=2940629 RepID=UPI002404F7EB|nr:ribonuclease HIII [Ereboglobus sp. PH5-10]MDF9827124.1 ribonuclease HIII [Ereboglobus sp. PH5-10]
MAKKKPSKDEEPKKLSSYTIKLDDAQMEKLRAYCERRLWLSFEVAYSRFAYKADHLKLNVTAYTSGKVVIAGKGTEDFVRDVIEPEITGAAKLGYDEVLHPDWFEPHAGLDESGKGDFFGPVITATVIADKAAIESWIKEGVRDSKKVADTKIVKLDEIIRKTPGVVVEVFAWEYMTKYNELMMRPRANLNLLLAWQHARGLIAALAKKKVPWGLLDQFSEQPLVQRELKKKNLKGFELRMRTKAEEDPVVAAASICARAEYVRQMQKLSKRFGAKLQKGAGPLVKKQATEIIERFGARALGEFGKLHFRTAYEVVSAAGKLNELSLPVPKDKFVRE